MTDQHDFWREQCDAARGIKERFGTFEEFRAAGAVDEDVVSAAEEQSSSSG